MRSPFVFQDRLIPHQHTGKAWLAGVKEGEGVLHIPVTLSGPRLSRTGDGRGLPLFLPKEAA